jgi:hypothetical protein
VKIFCRVFAAAFLIAMFFCSTAQAGVYADDLAKCLVSSTTTKDKTDLVRWMFATAALHPDVSSIASVSAEQRTAMTRSAAQLFERLLTESCRAQFRDAVKYEGAQTLVGSFQVLGGVAMRALMEDPAVAKGFQELDSFVSKEKINAVVEPEKP